jgi:hypothetical protein
MQFISPVCEYGKIYKVRDFVDYDYRIFLIWPLPGNFAVNYNVCLMTRIQKMSLDYHFKVEQQSGSFIHAFFGFNGKVDLWPPPHT